MSTYFIGGLHTYSSCVWNQTYVTFFTPIFIFLVSFEKKIGKYFLFERHESLWNRSTMNNIIRLTYVDKSCEPENKLSKNNFIYIPSWYLYIQPYHHYNDFYSTAISKIVINNKYRKCIFILFYTCIIPGSIDNIIWIGNLTYTILILYFNNSLDYTNLVNNKK